MATLVRSALEIDTDHDALSQCCERAAWSPAPGGPLAASLTGIPYSTPLSAELTIRLSTSLLKRKFLNTSVDLSKPEENSEAFEPLRTSLNNLEETWAPEPQTSYYKSLSFKKFEDEEQRDFTKDFQMDFQMPSVAWDHRDSLAIAMANIVTREEDHMH
jgi:hypothetical protein